MASTVAKTKQDVDNMSVRDRLYDSLSYTYGKKGERISSEYDKAKSAADRQSLSRGMQRSYYTNQTLANIDKQKIDALDDNESALIADYENRLMAADQQQAQQDQWERQFAANREDTAWNQAFQQSQADYQRERDKNADNQWQLTFNAGREDAAWNKAMQERQYGDQRADVLYNREFNERQYADQRADVDWNRQFQTQQYADQRADVAYNREFNERQYADQRADTAWNQAFQTQQYTDQRADVAYNREFNERQYADQRSDVAYNREFAERQFETQQEQWRQQFDYSKMSDEQKINYNWVTYSLQNGNDVSDDMLTKAGLSRDDYNKMKQQAQASTRGSYNPGPSTPAWQKAGFASEADYNDAKNLGITDPAAYQDYKSKQKTPFQILMDQLNLGNTSTTQTTASGPAYATGSGSTGLTSSAPKSRKADVLEIEMLKNRQRQTGISFAN